MKFEGSRMRELVIVLLAAALRAAAARVGPTTQSQDTVQCESKYLRYSLHHVMCQQNVSVCYPIASGLRNTDKDTILTIHNRLRNQIATGNMSGVLPAADMLEMEWDDELATLAQADANLCDENSLCGKCIATDKFPEVVGFSFGTFTDSDDHHLDWEEYAESMCMEARYILGASSDSPIMTRFAGKSFAQLAWSRTWRVGCGFAKYRSRHSGPTFEKRYSCVYGPGATVLHEDMYSIGPACSRCPEGTCCGSSCRRYGLTASFEGLCKVTKDGPSAVIDEENLLWTCQFNTDTQRGCTARTEPADAFVNKKFFSSRVLVRRSKRQPKPVRRNPKRHHLRQSLFLVRQVQNNVSRVSLTFHEFCPEPSTTYEQTTVT